MVGKTTHQLWLDYSFLTKEMVKFLGKQEMDLFYELMNQREQIQVMITQTADDGFRTSADGRRLLLEIQSDSHFITHTLQFKLNTGKRQHQVSAAYDGDTGAPVSRMSWKR